MCQFVDFPAQVFMPEVLKNYYYQNTEIPELALKSEYFVLENLDLETFYNAFN